MTQFRIRLVFGLQVSFSFLRFKSTVDPIRIDWGDGTIEDDMFPLSETSRYFSPMFFLTSLLRNYAHTYPTASKYFMRVYAMSSCKIGVSHVLWCCVAGLYAFRHLVVNASLGVGSVTPVTGSVTNVTSNITSYGDWRGAGEFLSNFLWNFRINYLHCHGIRWRCQLHASWNWHHCHCQWRRKSKLDNFHNLQLELDTCHSYSEVVESLQLCNLSASRSHVEPTRIISMQLEV